MKSFIRVSVLLLLFVTAFCSCTSRVPNPAETTVGQNTTDSVEITTTSNETEEPKMPSLLCEMTDTVHLEDVLTEPTFIVATNLPEDSERKIIVPHFTVNAHMVLQRRAVPGKHAWIGNGYCVSFNPTQGINDRGVVVFMNSGDPVMEVENTQYGMGTTLIARILLEECGTAEEAVRLLTRIIQLLW